MALKFLDLTGTPYERGFQHGSEMAVSVAANIQTYRNRFLLGGASRERIDTET
ncbi:MAG: hypothetical protein JKY04_03835, partial [Sneathiella sp.]|nr:hypothetical protein [Sneathiella sp.]